MEGMTLEAAASAAGMSERTARTWQHGPLPSKKQRAQRDWRTREDPFEDVWPEVEALLVADEQGRLEAKTILDELRAKHPSAFEPGQLRTLQRRVRVWRAERGPEREVFFQQEHAPGQMGSFDFTHCAELRVTIAGVVFAHMFFEFVLAHSGWRFVQLAFGETFEALLRGLQGAFRALRGVPRKVRMDNLSAATHELAQSGGRGLSKRFAQVASHYGFEASRIQPGESHENGVVEKAHHLLKSAIEQALLVRGHRDFVDVASYVAFVERIVDDKFVQPSLAKLAVERPLLGALPGVELPEYTRYLPRVRKWSTIHVAKRIYSVPSRLIGHEVEARVYADIVEVRLPGANKPLLEMPRLRGAHPHRIDYRHVIWSLVRKPAAFAAYRYREELFPSLVFRRAYDALRSHRGDRADVEYVRILHLAASTSEAAVEHALAAALSAGTAFDYAAIKAVAKPESPDVPDVRIAAPDLSLYDALVVGGGDA